MVYKSLRKYFLLIRVPIFIFTIIAVTFFTIWDFSIPNSVKRFVLHEEFLDSLMYDTLYDRPSEKPYVILLGASAGYYSLPKAFEGNWKFEDQGDLGELKSRYLGAFTGNENPLFYFPILKFLHDRRPLLIPGTSIVLTLTDVPLSQGDNFDAFFNRWHNTCDLYDYNNGFIKIKKPHSFFIERHYCNLKRFSSQIRTGGISRVYIYLKDIFVKKAEQQLVGESNSRKNFKKAVMAKYKKSRDTPVDTVFDIAFRKELDYLTSINMNIVFVMMPQGSARRQYTREAQQAHKYYKGISEKYKFLFLDYFDSFEDDHFITRDYIHLNTKGKSRLSKQLFIDLFSLQITF